MVKKILVTGAGGFIGNALCKKLTLEGHHVLGVDIKYPEFNNIVCPFEICDLRSQGQVAALKRTYGDFDEIYNLAANMGGMFLIFSKENDADIMSDSTQIHLNVLNLAKQNKAKVFYSSSACVYNESNQLDKDSPTTSEDSAIPANPDSCYGWEKLYAEKMYDAFRRNKGVDVRIGRFHNIFGPFGTFKGGREKAPAAMCRKVAEAPDGGSIEVFGDGQQTRSFLYIDECLEGVQKLMESNYTAPINIGSEEMISINNLAKMVIDISGKDLTIKNTPSDWTGVRGRNSDNRLIRQVLGWEPTQPLRVGMEKLYKWVQEQVQQSRRL